MKTFKKYGMLYLIFTLVLSFSPKVVKANVTATEDQTPIKITQNQPRVLTTSEEKLPMSRNTKIVLGVLATALVAGLAAALSGGSSGGGDDPEPTTGNVSVGW